MKSLSSCVPPALTLLLLVSAGCSSNKVEATKPTSDPAPAEATKPTSDPAPAEATKPTSDPASATEKLVVGRATWYGPGFYGNKTASGEILQMNTLTAAHSQLPFGTKVKVTREDTNESVIVVINDRKPFREGTVIDLAHGAAERLEIDEDGEAVVSLVVLD